MRVSRLSCLFLSFLAPFMALSAPTPSPDNHNNNNGHTKEHISIKDQPGLSDSKRKPPLISGNTVITSDPNIVLRSNDPDVSFPPNPEFRKAQGLDTLRGFIAHRLNFTTHKWDIETTIVVFHVPETARGKYCSFHFFFGSGDSQGNQETINLWSLDGNDNTFPEEFKTTWNNRPYRNHQIAQFVQSKGPKLTTGGEGNDAHFSYYHTPKIEKLKKIGENGAPPVPAFLCDPFIGKTAYELEAKPTNFDEKGNAIVLTSAWSMNKGLMIEIHGLPAPKEEHGGADNKDGKDEGDADQDEEEGEDEVEDEDEDENEDEDEDDEDDEEEEDDAADDYDDEGNEEEEEDW